MKLLFLGSVIALCIHAQAACGAQSLGADAVVDYTKDKFEEMYANDPFDVVLDLVGGEQLICCVALWLLTRSVAHAK